VRPRVLRRASTSALALCAVQRQVGTQTAKSEIEHAAHEDGKTEACVDDAERHVERQSSVTRRQHAEHPGPSEQAVDEQQRDHVVDDRAWVLLVTLSEDGTEDDEEQDKTTQRGQTHVAEVHDVEHGRVLNRSATTETHDTTVR